MNQTMSNVMLQLSTVSENVPNYFTAQLNGSINPIKLQAFHQALRWLVESRFTGHWYPQQPERGSAFRCITRSNLTGLDMIIYNAMSLAQWTSIDRAFAEKTWKDEFQLWCDPGCISVKDGVIPTARIIWGTSIYLSSTAESVKHARSHSEVSVHDPTTLVRLNKAVPIVRPSSVNTAASSADLNSRARCTSSSTSLSDEEGYNSSLDGSDVSLTSSALSYRQQFDAPIGRLVQPSSGRITGYSGAGRPGLGNFVNPRNSTRTRRRRGQGGAKKLAKSISATQSLMASIGGFVSYMPSPMMLQAHA